MSVKPPFDEARKKMTSPIEYHVPLIPKRLTIYEIVGFGGILLFVLHLFPLIGSLLVSPGHHDTWWAEAIRAISLYAHWGALAMGGFCLLLAWIQRSIQYAKTHPDWDACEEDEPESDS